MKSQFPPTEHLTVMNDRHSKNIKTFKMKKDGDYWEFDEELKNFSYIDMNDLHMSPVGNAIGDAYDYLYPIAKDKNIPIYARFMYNLAGLERILLNAVHEQASGIKYFYIKYTFCSNKDFLNYINVDPKTYRYIIHNYLVYNVYTEFINSFYFWLNRRKLNLEQYIINEVYFK